MFRPRQPHVFCSPAFAHHGAETPASHFMTIYSATLNMWHVGNNSVLFFMTFYILLLSCLWNVKVGALSPPSYVTFHGYFKRGLQTGSSQQLLWRNFEKHLLSQEWFQTLGIQSFTLRSFGSGGKLVDQSTTSVITIRLCSWGRPQDGGSSKLSMWTERQDTLQRQCRDERTWPPGKVRCYDQGSSPLQLGYSTAFQPASQGNFGVSQFWCLPRLEP